MNSRPEFTPVFWQGLLLLLPIVWIRFGLAALVDRRALPRLQYFPPLQGIEQFAYYVYQATTVILFVYPLFLTIKADTWAFAIGLPLYLVGLIGYALATGSFSRQQSSGFIRLGIYRLSRNPMYVAYLLCLAGIAFLTASWLYLIVTAIFQLSVHWIILSEERWCLAQYGREYEEYLKRVPRYLLF